MKKTKIILSLIIFPILCLLTILLSLKVINPYLNEYYQDRLIDNPLNDIKTEQYNNKNNNPPVDNNKSNKNTLGNSNKGQNINLLIQEEDSNVREIYRPELDLLIDTLKLMQNRKVLPSDSGNQIKFNDYNLDNLEEYKRKSDKYNDALVLDESILPLFQGEQAKSDIEAITKTARTEYIEFLRENKVAPDLIEEVDTVVFPADKDHLWISRTNNIYKEFSFVSDIESKHYENPKLKEAYMRFEMGSSYPATYQVHLSGLIGDEPSDPDERIRYWKEAREIGIRSVFYHEMTHVLQIAYKNIMIKKYGDKYDSLPLEEQTMMGLSDSGMFVDTNRTPFTKSDNLIISKESQAELMEQYFIVKKYNFNDQQAKIYWNNIGSGARMNDVRRKLKVILNLITSKQEKIDYDSKYMKYRSMNMKLKDMFEAEAPANLKDFLIDTSTYTSVNDQSYAIGYSVNYSDEQVRKILNGLRNI